MSLKSTLQTENHENSTRIRGFSKSNLGKTGSFVSMKLRTSLNNESNFLPTLPNLSESKKLNKSIKGNKKITMSTKSDKLRTAK